MNIIFNDIIFIKIDMTIVQQSRDFNVKFEIIKSKMNIIIKFFNRMNVAQRFQIIEFNQFVIKRRVFSLIRWKTINNFTNSLRSRFSRLNLNFIFSFDSFDSFNSFVLFKSFFFSFVKQLRVENVKYFDFEIKQKNENENEKLRLFLIFVINVNKYVYYINVYIFVDKLKNLTKSHNVKLIINVFIFCFRDDVLM